MDKSDSLYPTATKYSNILYASDTKLKPESMKILAGHLVVNSPGELTWEKDIQEAGDYEVIISYSDWKGSTSVTLTGNNNSVQDTLPVTGGVYLENKEWYNFNCERKLLKGTLSFVKGSNTLQLTFNSPYKDLQVVLYTIELVLVKHKKEILKDISKAAASRPDMEWFSSMKYGVMFHWTSQSAPESGPIRPYKDAVADFNVPEFVEMVKATGADYVIFTGNHAEPHFPGPVSKWESEYPGQTTERDLIMEISNALKKENIRFILYLATHIYAKQDKVSTPEFDRLNTELISAIGQHYKTNIDGYWLDGFYQSFQHHPTFDFEKFYKTTKEGNASRLVALNSWLYPVVTQWQDYWAGEVYTPSAVPGNRILDNGPGKGLPFQSLIVLENDWVHEKINTPIPSPRLKTEEIIKYISSCREKGPVTINLGIYQNGKIGTEARAVMSEIKKTIGE